MNEAKSADRLAGIQEGDALPERDLMCDNVQSMMYNAALWNGHRIHFDEPYARQVEGYPGLVVPGPLLGDWLLISPMSLGAGREGSLSAAPKSNGVGVASANRTRASSVRSLLALATSSLLLAMV